MKNIFFLMMCSLILTSCEQQDSSKNAPADGVDYDNSGVNIRDRNSNAITPIEQSESGADRPITQNVRQAIMSEGSLSTNAKNIKITTVRGVVTLRGSVANAQEKEAIGRKANDVEGVVRVDNQLEVSRNY